MLTCVLLSSTGAALAAEFRVEFGRSRSRNGSESAWISIRLGTPVFGKAVTLRRGSIWTMHTEIVFVGLLRVGEWGQQHGNVKLRGDRVAEDNRDRALT